MSDDYDDYDDYERRWPLWAAGGAAILLVSSAVLWFGFSAISGGDETETVAGASPAPVTVATIESAPDTAPDQTDSATTTTTTTTTQAPDESGEVAATAPEGSTPDAVPTEEAAAEAAPPTGEQSYETLPDGRPVPVLAIFDDDVIALSGAVPSPAAAERLRILALSYSNSTGAEVVSFLTSNPDVPVGVGVRLVEVNSVQFDDALPSISSEYAAELDRIVALMTSLPNITVDVIGHTAQDGDEGDSVELSASRAQASVEYLVAQGIDATRLSARGAGSTDLLTLNNDDVASALNRRTEFVVFGLLVDDSEPS